VRVRIIRWCLVLLGGVLIGAGLELHGFVAIVHHMVNEVDNTFFLFRAVGRATSFLLGGDQRMALAIKEVPPEVVAECARSGYVLMIVGALLALTAPLLRSNVAARGRS
jgi:hypothetical protein